MQSGKREFVPRRPEEPRTQPFGTDPTNAIQIDDAADVQMPDAKQIKINNLKQL